METENQAELNAPVSQQVDSRLDKPVGTIEIQKLKANFVDVLSVQIKPQTKKDDDKVIGEVVHVQVKHPDADNPVNLTKCVYIKNKAIKESGLWYNEDKEGNIQKGSALAQVLAKANVTKLKDLVGLKLPTEPGDSGYLCLKAY